MPLALQAFPRFLASSYFYDDIFLSLASRNRFGSQGDTDPIRNKPTFYPIENIDKVDEFRRKVGLNPLVQYAKTLNINYKEELMHMKSKLQNKKK